MQKIGGYDTDVDTVCSFLNLLHGSTFKNCTFCNIEDKPGNIIQNIAGQSIKYTLEKENSLQLKKDRREGNYEKMKCGEKIDRINLTVLFDMGWNKHVSGTRYDSKV